MLYSSLWSRRGAPVRRAFLFFLSILLLASAVAAAGAELATPGSVQRRPDATFSPAQSYGDSTFSEDTVWRGDVLVTGVVTVSPQATLTLEPGTTVRFRGGKGSAGGLLVQGRLVASGSEAAQVLFAAEAPDAGRWQGITLLGSAKNNLLENCRIEGATSGLDALYSTVSVKNTVFSGCGTGVRCQESLLTVEGGEVRGCEIGIELVQSEAEVYRTLIAENRHGVVGKGASLYLVDGTLSGSRETALTAERSHLKLAGGAVQENGSGMNLSGCDGTISGMRVSANDFGLLLRDSRLRITGSEISGNTIGFRVEDGAAVAWGNAIFDNSSFDVYNAGRESFRAPANWWGGGRPKVYENDGLGAVLVAPLSAARPQPAPPQ